MGVLEAVSLLAGVALFLFGMTLMGDGLKRVSGNKLEPILFRLSGTPVRALLLGTGVTAVIQSSSATSVMAVGFVNSGLMSLRQAINVILGAILGTSITGWVLCLSYIEGTGALSAVLSTSTLTGLAAVAGVFLRLHGKTPVRRNVGDILMGFALLMFGMHMMSGAVSLLQALSVTGALTFDAVLPLLMGINIGAALPVLLSAIGATTEGKRAAAVYLVAAVIGVIGCSAVFYGANAVFHFPFMSMVMDPFSTALVNTLFRLANLLLLAPFTGLIEALVTRLVRGDRSAGEKPMLQLEERFLAHPALALEQSKTAMEEMAEHTRTAVRLAARLLHEPSPDTYDRVLELENQVDRYEDQLGSYLLKLSLQVLTPRQSGTVSKYLHTLSDFERISDHARNIAESTRELFEKQLVLSPAALDDLDVLVAAVSEITDLSVSAFRSDDLNMAARIEPLEEAIDVLTESLRRRQIDRLKNRQGNIPQNFVFNDLITDFERISDHCSNIALAILRLENGEFDTHSYEEQLLGGGDAVFNRYLTEYRTKYSLS